MKKLIDYRNNLAYDKDFGIPNKEEKIKEVKKEEPKPIIKLDKEIIKEKKKFSFPFWKIMGILFFLTIIAFFVLIGYFVHTGRLDGVIRSMYNATITNNNEINNQYNFTATTPITNYNTYETKNYNNYTIINRVESCKCNCT
jgi:hypothetical protein